MKRPGAEEILRMTPPPWKKEKKKKQTHTHSKKTKYSPDDKAVEVVPKRIT